jgi:hypothetical protein
MMHPQGHYYGYYTWFIRKITQTKAGIIKHEQRLLLFAPTEVLTTNSKHSHHRITYIKRKIFNHEKTEEYECSEKKIKTVDILSETDHIFTLRISVHWSYHLQHDRPFIGVWRFQHAGASFSDSMRGYSAFHTHHYMCAAGLGVNYRGDTEIQTMVSHANRIDSYCRILLFCDKNACETDRKIIVS